MNFLDNMTVKAKLMLLTIITLVSLLVVSLSGNHGITSCGSALIEVSEVRLPSILGLEIINEGQTAIKANGLGAPIYELDYNAQDKFAKIVQDDKEVWDRIEKGWKLYEPLPQTPEEALLWKQFEKEWAAWKNENNKRMAIIQKLANNRSVEEQKTLFKEFYTQHTIVGKYFTPAETTLGKIIDLNINIAEIAQKEGKVTISFSKNTMIAAALIAILVSIFFSTLITRSITSSLSSIQQGLNSFFSFLNRETNKAELIKLDSKDEFGQMAAAINSNISAIEKGLIADANAVANSVEVANKIKAGYLNEQITVIPNNPQLVELRNVLNEMLQTLSNKVSYDLNELELVFKAYIASDFTARIKNPKGQVDIITNNLGDEISTMLSNSLQNGIDLQTDASTLKQAVESLSTASNQQAASLEETAAAMEEMTSNVQNNVAKSNDMALMATQTDSAAKDGAVLASRTASAMTEIQSATNSINDAVAIIENIAFQTNILSLNAAVEAATAGDAGKGFAVVAQEVRNLANRSADAAKEIKAMASQAAHKSNEGMNIATELTRGFEVIADKIAQTASMVQDVSNANREQMQGIGQINTAVTQLDQMTQENAKVAAQADSIANATISKAEAMVQDAQSKEFVGKSNIRATQSSTTGINATRTSKPVQAAKPVVAKQKYASNAIAKNSSKHESDVWESF